MTPHTRQQPHALLEAVTGATDFMLVYLDTDFNFVWVNEPYARTCRMRPEEMVGRNHFELYPHAENEAIFRRVRDSGEAVFHKDKPFEFPDQPERGVTYWDWSLAPVKDAAGRVEGLVFSLRETTDHKRAQLRLVHQQRELYQFIEQAPVSMAMFDRDMNCLAYSQRWLTDYGRGHADLHGRNHYDIHPDLPEAWRAVHRRALAGETVKNDADHWRQSDGRDHWLRWAVVPWRDERGGVGGIIISAEDITESKRAEQALRQSEQRLRWALESARGGAWDLDLVSGEAWWSEEMYDLWGVEHGTCMRLENSLELVHEQDRERVATAVSASIAARADYQSEFRIRHPARGERWMSSRGQAIYDASGHPLRMLGITQDITGRKHAEEELARVRRSAEERAAELETVVRSVPVAVWIAHDPDCLHITGNSAAHELIRLAAGTESSLTAAEGQRPTHFKVFHEGRELHGHELPIQRAARGEVVRDFEEQIVFEDGTVRTALGNATPLLDEHGAPRGCVAAFVDITARKRAEEALRETDRRKDEFLAMLAHELRNPLAPIRNAAHVLGRLEIEEPRVDWARHIIERQVAQLTRLVDDLLDVSRIVRGKAALRIAPVELADLVARAVEAGRPFLDGKGQHFEMRLPAESARLEGDLARLTQVLVNLLDNAAKYTPQGGHIVLEAERVGEMVEIRVRDDGMGMPAELLPHVFDLFRQGERSPDRAQGGLGIGLTLVRNLVEMHGGQVTASSPGPDMGSTFAVRLPVLVSAPASPPATAQVLPASPAPTGQLKVLLVDDDPAVAESTAVFLELEGCAVRRAADGVEALRALGEFQPRLVLLDIGLPGRSGYEVARQIRQLPDGNHLLLVAVSGYGQEENLERSRAAGFDRHLTKPVDPDTLCALLAEAARR